MCTYEVGLARTGQFFMIFNWWYKMTAEDYEFLDCSAVTSYVQLGVGLELDCFPMLQVHQFYTPFRSVELQ